MLLFKISISSFPFVPLRPDFRQVVDNHLFICPFSPHDTPKRPARGVNGLQFSEILRISQMFRPFFAFRGAKTPLGQSLHLRRRLSGQPWRNHPPPPKWRLGRTGKRIVAPRGVRPRSEAHRASFPRSSSSTPRSRACRTAVRQETLQGATNIASRSDACRTAVRQAKPLGA